MKYDMNSEWAKSVAWVGLVAGCVITNEKGQYLMVQEKQKRAYKLWSVPGGRVDVGESIEDAAIREVFEETGYKVKLKQKIIIVHESEDFSVKHVFLGEIVGGRENPDTNEILKVKWMDFEEITELYKSEKIRRHWVYDVLKKHHDTIVA